MNKLIEKISTAKFKVITPHANNHELVLDFNPIINQFQLRGNYILIHWQAKPKFYRLWGIYKSRSDTYISLDKFEFHGNISTLQIPDSADTVPTAVLFMPNDFTN